jgi:hypothetical protein
VEARRFVRADNTQKDPKDELPMMTGVRVSYLKTPRQHSHKPEQKKELAKA